jgi:hypothetical protein
VLLFGSGLVLTGLKARARGRGTGTRR